MNFKFSTNFLLPYARKPAKYGGCGSTGLDATPTVQIHTGHPVYLDSLSKANYKCINKYSVTIPLWNENHVDGSGDFLHTNFG